MEQSETGLFVVSARAAKTTSVSVLLFKKFNPRHLLNVLTLVPSPERGATNLEETDTQT